MSTESCSHPFVEHPLNPIEARILGCLIEKQATSPETYPLTLNALVLACNQKTSREPLMNLAPGEVGAALRSLEGRGLTRLVMGNRADRWEQRCEKQLELLTAQVVLIGLLLLRGAQTLNELLTRSSRLHAFDDLDELQHQLQRLESRGLACQLPRQSGQREDRYMHRLGDPAELLLAQAARPPVAGTVEDNRIEQLEVRLKLLEERLQRLETATGGVPHNTPSQPLPSDGNAV